MFDTTPTKEATYSQPTMNSFTRVRSAKKKPKSKAVFAGAGARKTKDPKKVTVEQRLKEFPGQTLCKSGLVLFCRGCSHTLPLLKSSVKTHIDSKMHKQAVVEYLKSRGEDEEIKQYLTDHYASKTRTSRAGRLTSTPKSTAGGSWRASCRPASLLTRRTRCVRSCSAAIS